MSTHKAEELTRLNNLLNDYRAELIEKREIRDGCSTARDADGCYIDDSYGEADDNVSLLEYKISEIEEQIESLI